MLTGVDNRRRWWGTFFLVGAAGMLIWGLTGLSRRLSGTTFLWYWLACIGLAALAFFTALLDLWIIRRRARAERRELVRRMLQKTAGGVAEGRRDAEPEGEETGTAH